MRDRVRRDGIRLTATHLGRHVDADGWRHDQWRCTLSSAYWDGRFTTTYRMGVGHDGKKPKAEEVLDALVSDASLVENAEGFDDFCRDLGYDIDSRKAEQSYIACTTQTENLKNWLGARYNAYLWHTERL